MRKKNRNKRWKFGVLLVLLGMFFLRMSAPGTTVRADFGNFAGDNDYGGGGGGIGSDDDGGFLDGPFEFIIVVIGIIVLVIAYHIDTRRKKKREGESGSRLQPVQNYRQLDAAFDESGFRERMANLYVRMQECWHNKDIESLRPYFTDAFYYQSDKQLDEFRRNGRTPCTERVAVMDVSISGFYQDCGMDHMVVRLRTRIIAYILDDRTGQVISGDRNREKFMEYEWDICRRSGVVTRQADNMQSIACPHCGAPLTINQTAKCPYCGSVVNVVNEDWALNNIKGISQRTM